MNFTDTKTSLTPVHLPAHEQHVLPNGLRVVIAPRHALPMATVELVLETGGVHDPAAKAGLASFTAGLLRRGTAKRSADQINEAIEFVGGHLDVGAGPDATTIASSVTSENLALAMEIVADVALNPAFDNKEFQLHKRRLLAELAQELDDPSVIADRAMLASVLPAGHAYASPTSGNTASVSAITRGDLAKFHARWFAPARAALIVVGDVDPAEVLALAKKRFGAWKTSLTEGESVGSAAAPGRSRILVVHKAQSTQVQIRFTGLAFTAKTDPDYFPATVANGAFGGGFTSRLVDEIRVNRGLSYNANSRFLQLRHQGFFVFKSFTKNESVGELLGVALGEASKVREGGFQQAEIDRSKSYLTGLYPLRLETNEQIAAAIGEMLLYGLPQDWVDGYRERLSAVSVDEANHAARRHFFASPFGVVLVGDEKAARKGLADAGVQGDVRVVPIEKMQ